MKDKRKPGQSQLDYLWVNYGGYSVSNTLEEESIPTSEVVQSLVNGLSDETLSSLKVINNQLIGTNRNDEEILSLDISELTTGGKVLVEFGKKYVSEEGTYPIGTPVYFLKFSDGSELIAPIDSYEGSETSSVIITITDNTIKANIKINNGNSVVPLSETSDGISADLKISSNVESISLTKELEGLKAKIILDNAGRTLKFRYLSLTDYSNLSEVDPTTVYFIQDKKYFYFGEYLIGEGTTNLDNYYTKQEIDNNLATKEYVDTSVAKINWKSL